MFLKDLWYFALPSKHIRPGQIAEKMMLGEPLVVGRKKDGTLFVLYDVCPHQGMKLSAGIFDGNEIQCANHGWRFSSSGHCTGIPCLVKDQTVDFGIIKAQSYPCQEVQGNIWIFMGQQRESLPPVPRVPEMGDRSPQISESMIFDCGMDQAAIGLIDPAHGPFIHRSWFWRTPEKMQEKAKAFVPSHLGFTMQRHIPTSNTFALKLFRVTPEVEISFQLPGVHIEHLSIGKYDLCGMIVVTPISEFQTEVTYQGYWTIPGLNPFRSILKLFTHQFFSQDKRALGKMAYRSLKKLPRRFVGDPDAQAKWYFQLKTEFQQSCEENRPFQNPIKEQILRWRT